MEENEKPFGCVEEGCNMRFTNEDHLTVHKKKHDMILNLGNGQKMNIFVADQTPTPTRFIRNCEEVGLFQDLQNVNPFEETFRKAVEAGKTGFTLHDIQADSLHILSGGDDTLHTPHVFPFPHINDEPNHYKSNNALSQESSKHKNKFSDDNLLRSSSSDCSNGPVHTTELYNRNSNSSVTIQVPNINNAIKTDGVGHGKPEEENTNNAVGKETVKVDGKSMQLYLRMPDGKLLQLVQEPSSQPVPTPTPIPSPENGLALAKMKLKQALKKNGRIPSTDREPEEKARVPALDLTATPSPSSHRTQQRAGGSSYGSGSGEEDGSKKLKFRERNRAAAMRCREKRKTWIQELERRAEEMQATNQHLQSEVTSLRAEVAQLKTLLLAHKNCPITQAMNQAQMTNTSVVPVAMIQRNLAPIPHGIKRAHEPTPTTSHQKSVMVLKKPSKARRTNKPVSVATVKKRDKSPPRLLASQAPPHKTPIWHRPQKIVIESREGFCTTRNGSVSIQRVVVTNPISVPQTQLLVPVALSSLDPPALVRFGSASNEQKATPEVVTIIDGSESKVIKVNPNATRFSGPKNKRVNVAECSVNKSGNDNR